MTAASFDLRAHLAAGQAIPAHPLALDAAGHLDERSQRALTRYYAAAGAGGVAVGVHTTQFAIREHGLLEPVLALAAETLNELESAGRGARMARIAGVCGPTKQAVAEAALARDHGYHAALLSYGGWGNASDDALLAHARAVGDVLPVFGFYLQPAVGGRPLGHDFWCRFAAIEQVVAIKIAPFDRYATLDVVRAVGDAGRNDVSLYTGNDDSIVADLLTVFPNGRRMAGGLLGQWAVWTRRAVELVEEIKTREAEAPAGRWLARAAALTEANAAIFDAANRFAGCIAGIQEVLYRQGLLRSTRCLDARDVLSPGQADAITRVCAAHAELRDDEFVQAHLEDWRR
ncbi:MAG TPA: dihydrodipicolinate synthase family protein [Gemmatimonadaceae bacterium]|nr:dihydrodipicolinate synthase family protein [Gemmatimonadaceae bacterium]